MRRLLGISNPSLTSPAYGVLPPPGNLAFYKKLVSPMMVEFAS